MASYVCVVLLVPMLIASSEGQLVGVGTCPLVRPARRTTINTIQGHWYEQMKFISPRELRYNCVVYSFGKNSQASSGSNHHHHGDSSHDDRHRQHGLYWDPQGIISRQGVTLNVVGPNLPTSITGVHKLSGKVTVLHGSFAFAESTFAVISVDYPNLKFFPSNFINIGYKRKTWMVLYSCTNYGFFHIMQILVLTADRVPSQRSMESALHVIRMNDLPKVFLKRTKQSKCTTS